MFNPSVSMYGAYFQNLISGMPYINDKNNKNKVKKGLDDKK